MLVMLAVVAALAAGGTAVAVAEPSTGPAAGTPLDEELLSQRLDALAEVTDAAVVAEVRDGDFVWTEARGARQDGGDEAAEVGDRVRIGSLTKSMLSTVVLQLVEEGELGLDDEVEELAPGLLPYEETITVRQLLGHTAGVPDYFFDIYPSLAQGSAADVETNRLNEYRPEEIVETATKRPLDFVPGSDYQYSNTGYYALGLLVERLTGDSVEDEIVERVLEPAGMDASYLPERDPAMEGDHLDAYFEAGSKPGEKRIDTSMVSPTHYWAAGVTVSTAADMNRLYRAMFDGTLLSAESLDEARQFSEQSDGAYGLGLHGVEVGCVGVPGGKAMGHTGGALGHSTISFHSPEADKQVSFTYAMDPNLLPAEETEKVVGAIEDLVVAGLCGDEVPKDGGSIGSMPPGVL